MNQNFSGLFFQTRRMGRGTEKERGRTSEERGGTKTAGRGTSWKDEVLTKFLTFNLPNVSVK